MSEFLSYLSYLTSHLMESELLISLTLKTSLILAITGLANVLLHQSSAALRHWLWSIAFLGILLFPLATALLPTWQVRILPDSLFPEEPLISQAAPDPLEAPVGAKTESEHKPVASTSVNTLKSTSSYTADLQGSTSPKKLLANVNWSVVAMLVWMTGIVFVMTRILSEISAFIWLARRGMPVGKTQSEIISNLSKQLKIERPVTAVFSKHTSVPLTLGVLRPKILVPDTASSWTKAQWRTVFIHELAHIKRLDYLSNLVTHFVCALYWYNPLIWIAAKKIHLEREHASDDFVLRHGTESIDYAYQLLEIARPLSQRADPGYRMVAMANYSQMRKRMQHILEQKIHRHSVSRSSAFLSGITVAGLMIPLAVMHLQAEQGSQPDSISPGQGSLQKIISELSSDDPRIQKKAAWLLGEREDKKAVPALIEALQRNNPEVRRMAARALGELEDRRAVRPLISLLTDSSPDVRTAALWSLGEAGDKNAFYRVVIMLRDHNVEVRKATLQALRGIGCDPAFAAVTASLKDPDASVREKAARIIADFSHKPIDKELPRIVYDYSGRSYSRFLRLMPELENKSAIDYLIATLKDSSPNVRIAAAQTLGKLGNPKAVASLMDCVRDPNPEVRSAAMWALDQIGLR